MSVLVEKKGPVTFIVINRPEVRNAVNREAADALYEAFRAFDADAEARVAVFAGIGNSFCAGWDLAYANSLQDGAAFKTEIVDALGFRDRGEAQPRSPMGPCRLNLSKPVIAAIEGPAVAGGMELALWANIRVMAEDAYFGVYCRRWGIPLLDGGTVRLPRLVGHGRALDMILTGRPVDAEEALSFGLVDRVVDPGTAREAAERLAREIARFPQRCLRADRASAYRQWDVDLVEALKFEGRGGVPVLRDEASAGAARFAAGYGRGGDFESI